MKENLEKEIKEILAGLGVAEPQVAFDYPARMDFGDLSTNIAMVYAKQLDRKPIDLANEIAESLKSKNIQNVTKVGVAAPGFINFFFSPEYFGDEVFPIVIEQGYEYYPHPLKGQKIMVEFTDPNPFKEFHIGHLMSNTIGESISRILEWNGAEIKRANWQGDVGMHVAKAVWGMMKLNISDGTISDLGKAYAYGAEQFEKDESLKTEITEVNKKVFSREDESVNKIYDFGRKISLDYFETIYKRLGTKFDYYFFESKEGIKGKPIVEEYLEKGVFEKSEGAVIFPGEKYGLHTRVFINSQGLPTYEAKELGLNREKFIVEPDLNQSIIVTGNEIQEYFKVLLKVISLIFPDIASKTKHLPHGMLRLPQGKMSSRTGNIVTAESLIDQVKEKILEIMNSRISPEQSGGNKSYKATATIAEQIAVGAIKYSILRQAIGGDIIFDFDKSISFEGDSGPYLQYSAVRAKSLIDKAEGVISMSEILPDGTGSLSKPIPDGWQTTNLERLLARYFDVTAKAGREYAPHYLVTYLVELAGEFNSFYASHKIIDKDDPTSSYRLVLTVAFARVMVYGLGLLGIKVPDHM